MTNNKNKSQLHFLPLGGIGEIGMNCYLYGAGSGNAIDWFMVDLGITFPDSHEPGIEAILPDIRFVERLGDRFKGIIITHAHEDHYGAVPELFEALDVPIYTSQFTAQMLRAKLRYDRLEDMVDLRVIKPGKPFQLGPFELELVQMAHSIPEPQALYIRHEAGTILHTGDWKLDPDPVAGPPSDEKRLKEIGKARLDILVCDSTNANKQGTSISEADVAKALIEQIASCKKRVAVTSFASNIARIKSVAEAAYANDRSVVLAGRALQRNVQVAKETGYIPEHYSFLSEDEFAHLPRENVCVLLTGSQGEGRAALARMVKKNHPRVKLDKGDTLIFSSRTIPGNEKLVGGLVNGLSAMGVDIITDSDAPVHVTGHPRQGELSQLYDWVKPDCLIPMHGEEMHLNAHAAFAKAHGIKHVMRPNNGDMCRLTGERKITPVDIGFGRLYRDGEFLVDDDRLIRIRRKLGYGGHAVVSLIIDQDGSFYEKPNVTLLGMPDQDDEDDGELLSGIHSAIDGVLKSLPKLKLNNRDTIRTAMFRAVRNEINNQWGKKPLVTVHVSLL